MITSLYEEVKESVKEIFSYLEKTHSVESIKVRTITQIQVESNTVSSYHEESAYLGLFLLEIKMYELIDKEFPRVKKCVNRIKREAIGFIPEFSGRDSAEALNDDTVYQYVFNNTLAPFLNNYFKTVQSFHFNEEVFKKVFQEFERAKSCSTEKVAFIPLYGFETNRENIELDENLYIEKMYNSDFQRIYDGQFGFGTFDVDLLINMKFKICYRYKDTDIHAISNADRILKNAVISLRLASAGKFHPIKVYHMSYPIYKEYYFFNSLYHHKPFEPLPHPYPFHRYIFNEKELYKFKEFFSSLKNADQAHSLKGIEVAIEKFNQSFSRSTVEDKILDYVTALDSSLLYSASSRHSNFYKLCVRCALLVRNQLGMNVFRFTDFLVVLRHDIVHSGKRVKDYLNGGQLLIENRKYSLEEFLDKAEALVRAVIIEYLLRIKAGTDIGTINHNMEEIFFTQVSREEDPAQYNNKIIDVLSRESGAKKTSVEILEALSDAGMSKTKLGKLLDQMVENKKLVRDGKFFSVA